MWLFRQLKKVRRLLPVFVSKLELILCPAYRHQRRELLSVQALEALHSRVLAMERASQENESILKALMATVESMRQLLIQQHGPLPSPLQSGLNWRRSLPPSLSASRIGSPLAQSPLLLAPDTTPPLNRVTEETVAAGSVHSTGEEHMESGSAISAQQVSTMLTASDGDSQSQSVPHPPSPSPGVQVQPPEPAQVASASAVRSLSTSGSRLPSTTHLEWGWANVPSTGPLVTPGTIGNIIPQILRHKSQDKEENQKEKGSEAKGKSPE